MVLFGPAPLNKDHMLGYFKKLNIDGHMAKHQSVARSSVFSSQNLQGTRTVEESKQGVQASPHLWSSITYNSSGGLFQQGGGQASSAATSPPVAAAGNLESHQSWPVPQGFPTDIGDDTVSTTESEDPDYKALRNMSLREDEESGADAKNAETFGNVGSESGSTTNLCSGHHGNPSLCVQESYRRNFPALGSSAEASDTGEPATPLCLLVPDGVTPCRTPLTANDFVNEGSNSLVARVRSYLETCCDGKAKVQCPALTALSKEIKHQYESWTHFIQEHSDVFYRDTSESYFQFTVGLNSHWVEGDHSLVARVRDYLEKQDGPILNSLLGEADALRDASREVKKQGGWRKFFQEHSDVFDLDQSMHFKVWLKSHRDEEVHDLVATVRDFLEALGGSVLVSHLGKRNWLEHASWEIKTKYGGWNHFIQQHSDVFGRDDSDGSSHFKVCLKTYEGAQSQQDWTS